MTAHWDAATLAERAGGQLVAGDALGVLRPCPPAPARGDGRAVAVFEQLLLLLVVVEDLKEDHPDELADALRVAVDTRVFAHDVLDGLDRGAEGHGDVGATRVESWVRWRPSASPPATPR